MDGLSPEDRADSSTGQARPGRSPLHTSYRPSVGESSSPTGVGGAPGARVGLKVSLAILLFYTLVIIGATYPRITMLTSTFPGLRIDAMQHVWIMNWYKSCLFEGKAPVYCPDIQYPVGAPLANFSPMLFQTLLFLPLSSVLKNDILTYNIIWYGAFVFSGLSVFRLAWTVLRDRMAATFAGLAAMLCTPMMLRGYGHLELMFAGSMCLFLSSWIVWVDRPRQSGLFASAGLYLLSALCAAYFAVLAVVPAVIYVAWGMIGAGRAGAWPWLRMRVRWFAAFVALVVPGLLLMFSAQIWAVSHGLSMHRSLSEFEKYGVPIWSYVFPTVHHALFAFASGDQYNALGYPEVECASYLGAVTLALMGYSAASRVSFAGSRFFWATFATLAVLSLGAYWHVGGYRVPMPALWLHKYVPIFQAIRAPSRFNLTACGIAAVLAGSGLARMLSGLRSPWARRAVFAAASALLIADLRIYPFPGDPVYPTMPASYEFIRGLNPHAALLELPLTGSGSGHTFTVTGAFWQTSHRMRTSSGYSGFANTAFDDLLVEDSPLSALGLIDYRTLATPDSVRVGIVQNIALLDYAWMATHRGKFDYIVLHRWYPSINERFPSFAILMGLLKPAAILEGSKTIVYDVARLPRPGRPSLFLEGGWRTWRDRPGLPMRVAEKQARIALYMPESSPPTVLRIEARPFRQGRRVALREGDATLARWDLAPDMMQSFSTPPLSLAAGMHELVLESDGESKPLVEDEQAASWDVRPYSLRVLSLELKPVTP